MKKFKRFLVILLSLTMVLSVLTACGNNQEENPDKNKDIIKVTVLTAGQRGDNSATDDYWNAVVRLNEDYPGKVEADLIELSGDTSKLDAAILEALDSGTEVLIAPSGYSMSDTANKYAADYPNATFYFIDLNASYEFASPENTSGMIFKQNEGTYLSGVLAASMSETGNIGFVGGVENPIINDFAVGYIEGAKAVNPNIKVQTSFVGDFQDSAKGKEIAGIQIGFGADFIQNVAHIAGLGALEGAYEAGVWGIGVDNDQSIGFRDTNPGMADAIITSMLKQWGNVVYDFVKVYVEDRGSINYGGIDSLGLKENAVGLAKNEVYKENVPQDIQDLIEKTEDDIISGKLKIPSAFDMSEEEWQNLKKSVAVN